MEMLWGGCGGSGGKLKDNKKKKKKALSSSRRENFLSSTAGNIWAPEKDVGRAGSGDMKCLLKKSFSGHERRSGGRNNCQLLEACFHVTATELMFNVPLGPVKSAQGGDALPASLHVCVCVCVNGVMSRQQCTSMRWIATSRNAAVHKYYLSFLKKWCLLNHI